MNKVPTPEEVTETMINALADTIIDDETGLLLSELDKFADLLTVRAYQRLLIVLDQCPFHECDIEICNDDGRDCSGLIKDWNYYNAWKGAK